MNGKTERLTTKIPESKQLQYKLRDAVGAASSIEDALTTIDAHVRRHGIQIVNSLIFRELFRNITDIPQVDLIISKICEKYSIVPQDEAIGMLIQNTDSLEKGVEVIRHFQNVYDVNPEGYALSALAKFGNPEDAIEAIAEFKDPGEKLAEGVLHQLLARVKNLANAEQLFHLVSHKSL